MINITGNMIENISEGPSVTIFTVSSNNAKRSVSFEDEEDFLFDSNEKSAMVENFNKKVPLFGKKEKMCLFLFVLIFLAALIFAEIFLYFVMEPAETDENSINFDFTDIMRKRK